MTPYIKLRIVAPLALVLMGLLTGISSAGGNIPIGVNIDDLTDTPTVTLLFAPPGVTPAILPDTAGEFLHFTLPAPTSQPAITFYSDFFEDVVGGTLSDRLLVTHAAGSPILDVQFASDPATITLPVGATKIFDIVENGNFQFAGSFSSPFDSQAYSFQVRSDRADVPAPATHLLLGSGLVVLGGATWSRGRRHPRRGGSFGRKT